MPFTFAHPAAIVPLRSRVTVTSALVVGSIAPDCEYLLRGQLTSTVSHTIAGVVLFCLPVGVVVYAVVRALRGALTALLPRYVRTRLPAGRWTGSPVAVAASIVLGALTHVLWDSFTHRNGWFVTRLGYQQVRYGGVPFYRLLQHGSSMAGFAVIAAVVVPFVMRQPPRFEAGDGVAPARHAFWIVAIAAPIAMLIVSYLRQPQIGTAIVRALDAVVVITLLFAAGVQAFARRARVMR